MDESEFTEWLEANYEEAIEYAGDRVPLAGTMTTSRWLVLFHAGLKKILEAESSADDEAGVDDEEPDSGAEITAEVDDG